ncbi:integrase core domain-containing protein [Hymenobacter siberiensis]|uniref:integrase core domain-containing protein n=1 Tax=Hymenobacter siberiensis TaxID=2848396 RepID=UPI001C1E7748|nr:integrase core domain-containing protein [Hymenobacter siberiensis]MBU6123114.1 integrase core domain-containing protein [Hymenobacter siberiensis]
MSTQRSCQLYGVSRQGLYQRRQRQARQAVRAEQVLEQVHTVRIKLPRLGTRKVLHKITPLLRVQGVACGRNALFTLLRQRGLLVPKKRSYTKTTGCLAALDRAVREAGRAATGCIHHSDRGSQYASDAYQAALKKAKLRCSMTDGYDCYQNALAERVNGILKDEFLFVLPDDLAQVRLLVDQAVHLYNEERPYLSLNYLTPNQVHQQGKSPAGKSEQGPCLIPVNI